MTSCVWKVEDVECIRLEGKKRTRCGKPAGRKTTARGFIFARVESRNFRTFQPVSRKMAPAGLQEAGRIVMARNHDNLVEDAGTATIHVCVPLADNSQPALSFPAYYAGK